MGDLTQNIDGFFWLSLSTIIFTSIGLFIRYAYKTKCTKVTICGGCLKVERDIETEKEEDMTVNKCKSDGGISTNTI